MDIIKIKNTDNKDNINKLVSLEIGEMALVRETNYERLYIKNTDNEITPIHRILDAGEFETPPPTIQEAWIDSGLAQWTGTTSAMNQVKFSTSLTGDFTPPKVSDFDRLIFMNNTFSGCTELTSLNINDWDTSRIETMFGMFAGCNGLTSLDLSNWNTFKVRDVRALFANCINLVSLNLNNFDASYMSGNDASMFGGCDKLNKITCKQAFKDYCLLRQEYIKLPSAMLNDENWIIVP